MAKDAALALFREYRALSLDDGGFAYEHLRAAIRRSIESGSIPAGQLLPGERLVAKQLSLSRATVRRAITDLVEDGTLIQRQGAGTFVATHIVKPVSKLTSFTEDMRSRGLNPHSIFLDRGVGKASAREAANLGVAQGSAVAHLHRIRYSDSGPMAIELSIIPASILPDPTAVTNSLYEVLQKRGFRPVRAWQRLHAISFTSEQAALLDVPVGSPGLAVERRTFLADGKVVEFANSWYRGDTYDFVAELRIEDATAS